MPEAPASATVTELGGVVTTLTYDSAGRLDQTLLPNGYTITRNHDAAGRLTNLVAADTSTTAVGLSYSYSDNAVDVDQVTQVSDSRTGEVTSYTYDAIGNRTGRTDATGTTTTTYDPLNRVTARPSPAAVPPPTPMTWRAT